MRTMICIEVELRHRMVSLDVLYSVTLTYSLKICIEVELRHRMVSLDVLYSVTLTYILKVKQFLNSRVFIFVCACATDNVILTAVHEIKSSNQIGSLYLPLL